MDSSSMALVKLLSSKSAVAALFGAPLSVMVGPVVGMTVVVTLGVICVAGFMATTQREKSEGSLSAPPA